jgi:Gas vesicle synthesis protein GvpL/GvpF
MPEDPERAPELGYYVYGVVPGPGSSRPSLRGIDGAQVEFVDHGDVAAAVSEMVLDRPPGRRAELVAHTDVVNALSLAGSVLPVQFGSIVGARASVVDEVLAPEHDRFVELLENLQGRHQFNLRATYVEDQILGEIVQTRPDIADLRRRTRDLPEGTMHPDLVRLGELVSQAMEHKREQDAEVILETVRPFTLDEAPRAGGGVSHLLDMAVLVEDDRVHELEDGLEALAEAIHERIRLRLTGPVAPYDFAGSGAWA